LENPDYKRAGACLAPADPQRGPWLSVRAGFG